jgi:hypothetical protein
MKTLKNFFKSNKSMTWIELVNASSYIYPHGYGTQQDIESGAQYNIFQTYFKLTWEKKQIPCTFISIH